MSDYPYMCMLACEKIGDCSNARSEYDECVICDSDFRNNDDHMHLFYFGTEGYRKCFGDLCGDCQSLEPDEARANLNGRLLEIEAEEGREIDRYRSLIAHLEHLKQLTSHLEGSAADCKYRLDDVRDKTNKIKSVLHLGLPWGKLTRRQADARRQKEEAEARAAQRAVQKQITSSGRAGYVYLVVSPEKHYKIGRTKSVPSRTNTLEIQLPFPIELLHSIQVSDMVWAERYLHRRFSEKRLNGEWFALEESDVDWIKNLTELEAVNETSVDNDDDQL